VSGADVQQLRARRGRISDSDNAVRGADENLPVPSTSAELAADVILRVLLAWIFENGLGVAGFHQLAGATALRRVDVEKGGLVGNALGLLEIVRDDGDGEFPFQFLHQVFNFAGRDGVERGAGLVHEQ
jgi:hypothetical protein